MYFSECKCGPESKDGHTYFGLRQAFIYIYIHIDAVSIFVASQL